MKLPIGAVKIRDSLYPSQLIEILGTRMVLEKDTLRYDIRFIDSRSMILIPVYENKKLVQAVGRRISLPSNLHESYKISNPLKTEKPFYIVPKHMRYWYLEGAPITEFLFNWDKIKTLPHLTLVENTFNAIAYSRFNNFLTTNFGSHLSNTQLLKIVRSKVKTVLFMWDHGTSKVANDACVRLKSRGIRAGYINLPGQPDEMYYSTLITMSIIGHFILSTNKGADIRCLNEAISNFTGSFKPIKSKTFNIYLDKLKEYKLLDTKVNVEDFGGRIPDILRGKYAR